MKYSNDGTEEWFNNYAKEAPKPLSGTASACLPQPLKGAIGSWVYKIKKPRLG